MICALVPHRRFVFTIPERLRLYLRYVRALLGKLSQATAREARAALDPTGLRIQPPGLLGRHTFRDDSGEFSAGCSGQEPQATIPILNCSRPAFLLFQSPLNCYCPIRAGKANCYSFQDSLDWAGCRRTVDRLRSPHRNRKKKGVGSVEERFRTRMGGFVEECLVSKDSSMMSYFNQNYIRQILALDRSLKEEYRRHLYLLASLELWHRTFLTT